MARPIIEGRIHGLLHDRRRLLSALSQVLTRAGGNTPNRAQINIRRRTKRKQLRADLRRVESAIVIWAATTYGPARHKAADG